MSARGGNTFSSAFEQGALGRNAGNGSQRSRAEQGTDVFLSSEASSLFLQRFRESKFQRSGHIFTGILFALFVVMLLVALLMGTNVYRSLYEASESADNMRAATALVANTVRANDEIDSVVSGQGPEGPALVLLDRVQDSVYETRIYLYQGNIVEEYAIAGNPYNPAKATALARSNSFDFDFDGSLVSIRTDEGPISVALRTANGGERS